MTIKRGHRFKTACFTLEGAGSFAVSFYFYYIYFFMRDQFGFGNQRNLAFAAAIGLVYLFASWQAGRFAQRCGYFKSLKVGFSVMILSLAVGSQLNSTSGIVLASAFFTIGQCFLWPAIEALVSEGEDARGLPRAVGTYNVVWASTNALGLFVGGTLVEKFGFKTLFYLPIALLLTQLALTLWLERHAQDIARASKHKPAPAPLPDPNRPSPAKARAFLYMAWLANPFAYIAINTFVPLLPGLAARFQLTPMLAGFVCSLWGFVRLGTFFALWFWAGWHYRFRWLVTAFATFIIVFVLILTAPNLAVLLVAQIFFGAAIGLIYYSSLFYSMDAGETKGEHGGIHEAAIGLGNFAGPATGAVSLQFLPEVPHSSVLAVSGLLSLGFVALVTIQLYSRSRR
ncbi:MAG TPA: MFS transporter [Verrucomicrobiae bacterium]|nr:MFS transporter [Verrucomicrobiae bacterium]